MAGLSDGNHTFQIHIQSESYYNNQWNISDMSTWETVMNFTLDTYSNTVKFTVDTLQPVISILSIENTTYNTTELPLNFQINEPTSNLSYCLDNQSYVAIAGNTTLTQLSTGFTTSLCTQQILLETMGLPKMFNSRWTLRQPNRKPSLRRLLHKLRHLQQSLS